MQNPIVAARYLCGFFFWLDAGSTVTLILDLTYAGAPGCKIWRCSKRLLKRNEEKQSMAKRWLSLSWNFTFVLTDWVENLVQYKRYKRQMHMMHRCYSYAIHMLFICHLYAIYMLFMIPDQISVFDIFWLGKSCEIASANAVAATQWTGFQWFPWHYWSSHRCFWSPIFLRIFFVFF